MIKMLISETRQEQKGLFGKGAKPQNERKVVQDQGQGLFGKAVAAAGIQEERKMPQEGLFGKSGAAERNVKRQADDEATRAGKERKRRVASNESGNCFVPISTKCHFTSMITYDYYIDSYCLLEERRRGVINRAAFSVSSEQTALVAKNVPASCNNVAALKRHFSKYGEVNQVFPNPKKATANIHFASHVSYVYK